MASALGPHLDKVSGQLQGAGSVQGPLTVSLTPGLLQQGEQAVPVLPHGWLQALLSLPQLHQGGVQGMEVIHGDLQG